MPRTIKRRPIPDHDWNPAGLHPVLRRVYAARHITALHDLDYELGRLPDFTRLGGIEAAIDLLQTAVEGGKRILIVGDYDADGATGCALAILGLRRMGAVDPGYLVPSRFDFGYGLSPEVAELAAGLAPDLLVTVDNGISSLEGIAAARAKGIRTLITDHHLPGPLLPQADAIVNPNLPGDGFPSRNLAGVGVMFYVLAALRARLRESGWFRRNSIADPNLASLLDLVALGTVADVVPLDHCNRILVAQGLSRIRTGLCRPGIKALLKVARRDPARLGAGDLGFAIGPRLNAAGRLSDMSLGIECLLCDDDAQALAMATQLDELNTERRGIQAEMQGLADQEMARLHAGNLPYGVCLYEPAWHQGVVGILASRLKDKWHRPVIAFARDNNGMIKGSGRSIRTVHLRDLLEAIATRRPGLIRKFGGHAMAAGLTLEASNLEHFQAAFQEELRRLLKPEDLEDCIYSDGELQETELEMDLAEAIRAGGPWGQGFPEPVFDGVFKLLDQRIVGERHLRMTLGLPGRDRPLEAIVFNIDEELWPDDRRKMRIAYRLDINEYQGRRSLQLVVEYMLRMGE